MKRPRPYIPIAVRAKVAARQADAHGFRIGWLVGDSERLLLSLRFLFGSGPYHLHHNPPLRTRKFNPRTGKYKPDANDPKHLEYLSAHEHHIRTNVRGEGALHPDRVYIKRERRLDRGTKPKRKRAWPKRKIPSRPFRRKP